MSSEELKELSGETIVMVDPRYRRSPGTARILDGVTLTFATGRRISLKATGDEEGFGHLEVLTEDEGDG